MEDIVISLTMADLRYLGVVDSMFDLINRRPEFEGLQGKLNNLDVELIFKDCPYYCDRGKHFNFDTKKFEDCPNCAPIVQRLTYHNDVITTLEDGRGVKLEVRLSDLLNIDHKHFDRYRKFEFDRIFPSPGLINTDIKNRIQEIMEAVYDGIVLGKPLECSYCFGLGANGNLEALVYPFLIQAFRAGLRVSRFTSASMFYDFDVSNRGGKKFEQFVEADVCIVLITPGLSPEGVGRLKALMQERANKKKGTLFVTTENEDHCSSLINYSHDVGNKFSATPVFVKYGEIIK